MYNDHDDAIWLQIHDFLFKRNSTVCAISHHLRKIKQNMECQQFNLENDINIEEEKSRSWPMRLEIIDFII